MNGEVSLNNFWKWRVSPMHIEIRSIILSWQRHTHGSMECTTYIHRSRPIGIVQLWRINNQRDYFVFNYSDWSCSTTLMLRNYGSRDIGRVFAQYSMASWIWCARRTWGLRFGGANILSSLSGGQLFPYRADTESTYPKKMSSETQYSVRHRNPSFNFELRTWSVAAHDALGINTYTCFRISSTTCNL